MIRDLVIMGIIIMVFLLARHIKKYNAEAESLRSRNAELLMENIQLKSLIGAYRNVYGNGYKNIPKIPKDTVDAVRYAMKRAHPDNGGKEEDFIRFQKCYEELTRKRG